MTPWLKKATPQAGPPMPGHIDYETLTKQIEEKMRLGLMTPAAEYLWMKAPRAALDQWGDELPLSAMQQDQLDRMFAILAGPMERGTALLHSGQLIDDEVDAIEAVFPGVYVLLVEAAKDDLFKSGPPLPAWAEAQLGILFRKPASAVYSPTPTEKPPSFNAAPKSPEGTQADRRELSVREGR
jgi:hypothetical protein